MMFEPIHGDLFEVRATKADGSDVPIMEYVCSLHEGKWELTILVELTLSDDFTIKPLMEVNGLGKGDTVTLDVFSRIGNIILRKDYAISGSPAITGLEHWSYESNDTKRISVTLKFDHKTTTTAAGSTVDVMPWRAKLLSLLS